MRRTWPRPWRTTRTAARPDHFAQEQGRSFTPVRLQTRFSGETGRLRVQLSGEVLRLDPERVAEHALQLRRRDRVARHADRRDAGEGEHLQIVGLDQVIIHVIVSSG